MIPDINLSQLPDPECASAADPPADTKSTTTLDLQAVLVADGHIGA